MLQLHDEALAAEQLPDPPQATDHLSQPTAASQPQLHDETSKEGAYQHQLDSKGLSQLLHHVQRERGASCAWVSSGKDSSSYFEVSRFRELTDACNAAGDVADRLEAAWANREQFKATWRGKLPVAASSDGPNVNTDGLSAVGKLRAMGAGSDPMSARADKGDDPTKGLNRRFNEWLDEQKRNM